MIDKNNYTAKDILALEYPENVRHRPGMYIGDTDTPEAGLTQCVMEIVHNAIDESLAGHCDNIKIIFKLDGSVTVEDNGRGIPVDMHETGVSAAEVIMCKLHAGAKFNQKSYQISGGLHGVGISVVNALSEFITAEIHRDCSKYLIRFEKGKIVNQLQKIDTSDKQGTIIHFKPCKEIFINCKFPINYIERKIEELAFLNSNVKIEILHESNNKVIVFHYKNGLKDYISHISKGKKLLHKNSIYIKGQSKNMFVEVALSWSTGYSENCIAFTNTIIQQDGGTHVAGMKSAITKAVQNLISEQYPNKKFPTITGEDIREGLYSIIAIKFPEPKFSSQTKDKLVSSSVRGEVETIILPKLQEFLEINIDIFKLIFNKALQAAKVREEIKAKKEISRKNVLIESPLPGKLTDCHERNPALCELYITEGDSAAGTAKNGRDSKYQAVLPIRGKLLNVERASATKGLISETINNIITSIGAGCNENCNPSKARYNKIIIMTDGDVDGSHIRTLLLTLFYRFMYPLIEAGYLYIAQPPLYGIKKGNKVISYLKNENALVQFLYKSFLKHAILQTENNTYSETNLFDLLLQVQEIYNKYKSFGQFSDIIYQYSLQSEFDILKALKYQYPDTQWKINNSTKDDEVEIISKDNDIINTYTLKKQKNIIHNLDFLYKSKLIYENKEYNIFGPNYLHEFIYQNEKNKYTFKRFKGLGEMLTEELEFTTLSPKTRNLLQVNIEDVKNADDLIYKLMGADVSFRKELITATSIYSVIRDF